MAGCPRYGPDLCRARAPRFLGNLVMAQ
jgi:hypothetical protein